VPAGHGNSQQSEENFNKQLHAINPQSVSVGVFIGDALKSMLVMAG
jgi:hypothetical protein